MIKLRETFKFIRNALRADGRVGIRELKVQMRPVGISGVAKMREDLASFHLIAETANTTQTPARSLIPQRMSA